MIRRREALAALAGLAAASIPRAAWAQGQDVEPSIPELFRRVGPMMEKIPIRVEGLTPGLSVLSGPGGNVAALAGPDGLLVVDCFVPGRGAEVVAAVRKLDAGPITLINTHWHFDHTGGNAALAAAGARIVAHANARKRLGADQYMAEFELKIPASPPAALPGMTVGDSATLYCNGEEIQLTHVPTAHTDGDLFIHFRKANVLHTGDLFSNGFFPNIDNSSDGWIGGMIEGVDRILATVDARTRIIPGHGPVGTRDDLKASLAMYSEARAKVGPLVDMGKTADEIVAARPLANLDARWGVGLFKSGHFTRLVANGLVKRREKSRA